MDNISTPTSIPETRYTREDTNASVSKETLDRIKQFARAYMPVPDMPGIVLN